MKKAILSAVIGLLVLGFSGCNGGSPEVTKKEAQAKKSEVEKDNIVADLKLLKDYKMKSFDDFFMFRYCNVNDATYKKYRSDIFNLFEVKSKNGAVTAFNNLGEFDKLEVIVSMSEIFLKNKFTSSLSGYDSARLELIDGALHRAVVAYLKQISLKNREVNVYFYYDSLYVTTSVSDIVEILDDIKTVRAKINLFTGKKSTYFEALDDYSKLTKIEKRIVRNTEV